MILTNRRLLTGLLIAVSLTSCRNKTVEITAILEDPVPGTYIFLDELKSDELISVDSFMISQDGGFEFKRKIKSPSFYLLKINQNNFLTMLLEPGEKIKMTSHFDSLRYPVVVTGSEGTALMAEYSKTLLKTVRKLQGLSYIHDRYLGTPDLPRIIDSLDILGDSYLAEINDYTKKYINDNLTSLVSLIALYQQVAPGVSVMNPERDIEWFKKVDSTLYSMYPEYEPVVMLHNDVQQFVTALNSRQTGETGSAGAMEIPEIALPSPEGDTIRLSSTRGSIVLLDFWASWCAPCRIENPNLVKAYETYSRKGFQIFQVSLDKTKEAWVKGIEDDKLGKWIHVSDLKYWNSVVVPLYNIESIPSNLLLDREGKVIASNLRGDALQRKLTELFN